MSNEKMTELVPVLLREAQLRSNKNLGLVSLIQAPRIGWSLVMERAVVYENKSNHKQENVEKRTIIAEKRLNVETQRMRLLELYTGYHVDEILGYVIPLVDEQCSAHRRIRLETSFELKGDMGYDFANGLLSAASSSIEVSIDAENTDASGLCEGAEVINDIGIRFKALMKRALVMKDENVFKQLSGIEESMGDMIKVWSDDLDIAEEFVNDADEEVSGYGGLSCF